MNYKALLIGVNEYQFNYGILDAVSNDITAMSQILINSPCQYQSMLVTGRNATRNKIERELKHFFESDVDDVLFLFWAGHGSGKNFITFDTNPVDESNTAISLEYLAELIEESVSSTVVVVLDCCYAGAIARGTPNFSLNVKGDGKVIMASCDYYQQSFESANVGHGHFTHCFLTGLGGAAATPNGVVTVNSLHDYICENISAISQAKQTPVLKLTMAGQFVLNIVEPTNQHVIASQADTKAARERDSICDFTQEEKIMIKALSIGDTVADVNVIRTLSDGGVNIYTRSDVEKASINFNLSGTQREFTLWVEVLESLRKKQFVVSACVGEGTQYKLTNKGYQEADKIDESVLDNIPSLLDAEINALSENEKIMLKAASMSSDGKIICGTDILSICERIETLDGRTKFASGQDARETALWNDVISRLAENKMLVALMGGKGKRYHQLTHKGYSIASRISDDVISALLKIKSGDNL